MHILNLSKRNGAAQQRLMNVAERFAYFGELDPVLIQALKPKDKDKEVRALKEREAVADLLEAIAARLDLPQKPTADGVTTVTDSATQPEPDAILTVTEPDGSVSSIGVTVELEGLPAPVLEPAAEEVTESSAEESTQFEDAADESGDLVEKPVVPDGAFAEEPAVEEIQEEKPAKSSKKSTGSKPKSKPKK